MMGCWCPFLLAVALAASASAPIAVASAAPLLGDLRGKHLRVTMVQEDGFVNMLGSDGLLLPPEKWSGFLVDVLLRVSQEAGFNYTLQPPTGNHSGFCLPTNLTGAARAAFYANQYNCGQGDAEDNVTDVLWGMYYSTRQRMARGISFTVPFASDKGLSMLTKAKVQPSWSQEATKIFKPFTPLMWFLSFTAVFVYTSCMWLLEDHQVSEAVAPLSWHERPAQLTKTPRPT
jgi:hypothetical protein